MYERMLNKNDMPTIEEMAEYCGKNKLLFLQINEWLKLTFKTEIKVVFPYGNSYGWAIAHRKKNKLMCNIFAEDNAFTVMLRLSDKQFHSIYEQLSEYSRVHIDNKYPCSDGGWIHYRVMCKEHCEDIKELLSIRCS